MTRHACTWEDAVEVREVGNTIANELLKRGFVMIAAPEPRSSLARMPGGDGHNGRMYYVKRETRYLFGRPEGAPDLLEAIKEISAERERLEKERKEAQRLTTDAED